MAQDTIIALTAATVTQLTDADATAITFQNRGGSPVWICGTTDATTPTFEVGAAWIKYNPGNGERNVALADLFPGIAAVRVWAYSKTPGRVAVSHD